MRIVAELPPVNEVERQRILSADRTTTSHRALLRDIPAMSAVELGGEASLAKLPQEFTVLAWNLERCLFPKESAANLAHQAPLVVLLSEMDCGMARTSQRHTTAEMAAALGMTYTYGVEFHELGLGGPTERDFCTDKTNARGWHGNAILSAVPFERATMIRLDDHGHWFARDHGADPDQPRIGGRNAIAAVLPTSGGPVCVVSTHLESNADADHRAAQFDRLMDGVDAFAPDMPVLVGGDLNTGNHLPPDYDWRRETLFDRARMRGYDWSLTAEGTTTRPSLITRHPVRRMKLDWICGRGFASHGCGILASLGSDGTPLSDHDAVWAQVGLLT